MGKYVLRLYIAGMTFRSVNATRNIKKLCEEYLAGNYDLEVVDLYLKPALAKTDQIFAAPTLIRKTPLPLRRITGDLSDRKKVLFALELKGMGEGEV